MSAGSKPLEELGQELPPYLIAEAPDFIEFLLGRHKHEAEYVAQQD